MNYCTNCGNKLDKDANVCGKCGKLLKKNKKRRFPIWGIILIVLLVVAIPIIIITAISYCAFRYISDHDVDIKKYLDNYILNDDNIGNTLDTGSLYFTLKNYKIYSDLDGNENNNGYQYLVLFFDVENHSDESIEISDFDFIGYQDYFSTFPVTLSSKVNGVNELYGTILPGEKASGYVAFMIQKNWNYFEVYYNNLFDGGIIFSIINDEGGLDV